MKLNRKQLRRIILRETVSVMTEPGAGAETAIKKVEAGAKTVIKKVDSSMIMAAFAAGGLMPVHLNVGMPIAAAMIVTLLLGKQLIDEPKSLYDSLDQDIKVALDGLVAAIKVVPENLKASLIENVVELINGATDLIS